MRSGGTFITHHGFVYEIHPRTGASCRCGRSSTDPLTGERFCSGCGIVTHEPPMTVAFAVSPRVRLSRVTALKRLHGWAREQAAAGLSLADIQAKLARKGVNVERSTIWTWIAPGTSGASSGWRRPPCDWREYYWINRKRRLLTMEKYDARVALPRALLQRMRRPWRRSGRVGAAPRLADAVDRLARGEPAYVDRSRVRIGIAPAPPTTAMAEVV